VTPAGVRGLVETVYGPERYDLDDVPDPLRQASNRAIGEDSAARSFANTSLLELDVGYARHNEIWTQDILTPTRLGKPVTVFRLAKWVDGRIEPFCGGDAAPKSWALSEVSIDSRHANGEMVPSDVMGGVERAKADWPEWEQKIPVLVLSGTGPESFEGRASKDGSSISVSYSLQSGLRVRG
jgi:CRISPR-associated endonuclease/helicase Cas3